MRLPSGSYKSGRIRPPLREEHMGGLAYDLLKLVAELVVLWMSASFLIKWHKSRP